ncbi:phospholipase A2 inhibitor and Ly6/PLAUR domain-containing protein-like [Microcaecilia unicolor]|uniref:Phospholipase A2 inhibitor and Ly6/PLAUR domain-containing protein-like n=1 Tax=Microcaecilia unicolor TaxID=1415580 RepID=A0A6P7YV38_9AMPH|nr:phospholipase A2 inhibitor and Ly6/PLAUR domain-containing protein-like [Microcaecilia unicolor]
MRAFLTSICIFSALIATGLSLTCDHCMNIEGDSCSGISAECNEGETCVTKIESVTHGDKKGHLACFKGCGKYDPKICKKTMYSHSDGLNFVLYTECCNEDNCNCGTVKVPPINTTENGFECPTCYHTGSSECISPKIMKCVGNEGQCFDFSGNMRIPGGHYEEQVIKGCVSAGACDIGLQLLKGLTIFELKRFSCI